MSEGTNHEILSRGRLKEMMDNDETFVLVDVLKHEAFESGHLPGAINIPLSELRDEAPTRLPDRHKTVVVYCASPSCTASDKAARVLTDMGYTDVHDYRGGKEHWQEGGLEIATEEPAAASA